MHKIKLKKKDKSLPYDADLRLPKIFLENVDFALSKMLTNLLIK